MAIEDIRIVVPFCFREPMGDRRLQATPVALFVRNGITFSSKKGPLHTGRAATLLSREWRETLWHAEALVNATAKLKIWLTIIDKSCNRGVDPAQVAASLLSRPLPSHVEVIRQPNLGDECTAYLSSIVRRYHSGLAAHTFFLQPDAFWDTNIIPQPWLASRETSGLAPHAPLSAAAHGGARVARSCRL